MSTNLTYHNKLDENQNLEAYVNYNFFRRDWLIAGAATSTTNRQNKRDFNVFGFGGKYHRDYDLFGWRETVLPSAMNTILTRKTISWKSGRPGLRTRVPVQGTMISQLLHTLLRGHRSSLHGTPDVFAHTARG